MKYIKRMCVVCVQLWPVVYVVLQKMELFELFTFVQKTWIFSLQRKAPA
jgi:hypothetical protein